MYPNNNSQFGIPGTPISSQGYGSASGPQPSIVAPSQPVTQLPVYNQSSPAKTIIIVILTILSLGLAALSAYLYIQFSDARSDVDGQIQSAVIEAERAQAQKLQADFEEEEKKPNRTFSGPEDYGNLSFSYPKTWSVYEEKDASSGTGDYVAYLHPLVVPAEPSSEKTIVAISVTIRDDTIEKVMENYSRDLEEGKITSSIMDVNGGSTKATIYTGTVKRTFKGKIALIKIRDKTAIIQTDSAEAFGLDFDKILQTLTFNS